MATNIKHYDLSKLTDEQYGLLRAKIGRLQLKLEVPSYYIQPVDVYIWDRPQGWLRVAVQVEGERLPRRWFWYMGRWQNSR